ncbi:magnesium transporter CorA [Hyphomicrobium methylovorum]|uniref:magnesium transporter CorA family protein n=1 Tax=Hyphomicrobium methylovorum TaxID=84 RepID=UPI0015E6D567|nr:magnesium transporter CorA family protein [Hyphomicrobium methylovorum]MBA2127096.1 magnesium transporter CorA [Hyphomicrobium methylovorum]
MITVYDAVGDRLAQRTEIGNLATAAWIDVLNPADDEDKMIEQALGIEVPTRSEMREIEASNRFYTENGAYYMTGIIVHASSLDVPMTSVVTFILSGNRLVTVRYAEPRAFPLYVTRATKGDPACRSSVGIMIGLVEMLIEREADLIERVQDEVERMAPLVFGQKGAGQPSRNRRLDLLLKTVGKEGDITARAQESAMSLNRLLLYFANAARERKDDKRLIARIESANNDITSLMESLRFLAARTSFLLDATLGMISTEQNQIIKLFSVMAVMLMPPTLVASIYGMNFAHMPELHETWGYPAALGLMFVSGLVPFLYFRKKGWL